MSFTPGDTVRRMLFLKNAEGYPTDAPNTSPLSIAVTAVYVNGVEQETGTSPEPTGPTPADITLTKLDPDGGVATDGWRAAADDNSPMADGLYELSFDSTGLSAGDTVAIIVFAKIDDVPVYTAVTTTIAEAEVAAGSSAQPYIDVA